MQIRPTIAETSHVAYNPTQVLHHDDSDDGIEADARIEELEEQVFNLKYRLDFQIVCIVLVAIAATHQWHHSWIASITMLVLYLAILGFRMWRYWKHKRLLFPENTRM